MRIEGLEQLEEIGRGGFGVVYRAWQPEFQRQVAVKVLPKGLDEAALSRFRREAAAMGSVSGHPNILMVHSAGLTDERQPYLVMPYLSGGSLADRLTDGQTLPPAEACAIGAKIASALDAAHQAGVLHRDVKPDNILFTAQGEPQLADFGIARMGGQTETATGRVTATLLYAAPEVLAGEKPRPASDTYSLGATLYAAISGSPAFYKATDEGLAPMLARIVSESPTPLTDLGVHPATWAPIRRAMAKSPNDRQPSVMDFARELLDLAGNETISAAALVTTRADDDATSTTKTGLPLAPEPDRDSEQRHSIGIAVIAALLVVMAIAGGAWAMSRQPGDDTASPATTSTPPPTSTSPPTSSTTAVPATTTTTGVTAERPPAGVQIFEDRIQAITPYFNDLGQYVPLEGSIDTPEQEAALLGAWWGLADWCLAAGNGREGVCFDYAATFLNGYFSRDPRTINSESWGAPGAIGGVIDLGYNVSNQYLGEPEGTAPFTGRPGVDLLCEPSCEAVIDR